MYSYKEWVRKMEIDMGVFAIRSTPYILEKELESNRLMDWVRTMTFDEIR